MMRLSLFGHANGCRSARRRALRGAPQCGSRAPQPNAGAGCGATKAPPEGHPAPGSGRVLYGASYSPFPAWLHLLTTRVTTRVSNN
ncbi:hypothetical protein D9X30_2183 [Cupriavidus sp. U2]|nr:hypothetical protein D9X30_2183 [Cupriavidus sp. U2]